MNAMNHSNWVNFHFAVFKGTAYGNMYNPENFEIRSVPNNILIEEETLLPQALDRIKNLSVNSKHSEQHVGTWAMTMLKHIFSGLWAITPGQRNDQSGRYPDIVVEKDAGAGILQPVLFCQLKKKGGDSLTTALNQLKVAIAEAMDQQGFSTTSQKYSTFAYVQLGTEVGIFEYHNVGTILDEQRVPHHNGFVPITQGYLLTNKYGQKKLVQGMLTPTYLKDIKLVLDSEDWDVPCIFDIEKKDHREYVYFILRHISSNVPRKYLFGKLQYLNEVSILLIH